MSSQYSSPNFEKIRHLISVQDRGKEGGPMVLLEKLKYKIIFSFFISFFSLAHFFDKWENKEYIKNLV